MAGKRFRLLKPRGEPWTISRLLSYAAPGRSGCLEWSRSRNVEGYGQLTIDYRRELTHRLSWILANSKEIPAGRVICHRCDNPPCINPEHLFLGSYTENTIDMWRKNRHARFYRTRKMIECGRLLELGTNSLDR